MPPWPSSSRIWKRPASTWPTDRVPMGRPPAEGGAGVSAAGGGLRPQSRPGGGAPPGGGGAGVAAGGRGRAPAGGGVGELGVAALCLLEPAELLVGPRHPVEAVARQQRAVGGRREGARPDGRQLAHAAQRLLTLALVEQQRHQLERRRFALRAVVGDLHQYPDGFLTVAGGRQLGGGGHPLAGFQIVLGGGGMVAGLGEGGGGEPRFADRRLAAPGGAGAPAAL